MTEVEEIVAPAAGPARDTKLQALLMMASFHGIAADEMQLRHEFGAEPFETQTLLLACKRLGLSAKLVRQPSDRLAQAPLPAIALDTEGRAFIAARHDATVASAPKILIQRPGEAPSVLPIETFLAQWSGELVLVTSKANFAGEDYAFYPMDELNLLCAPLSRSSSTRLDRESAVELWARHRQTVQQVTDGDCRTSP